MKKKRLFLGLSFAIGALALASCVKKNDSTTNQTKTPDVTKDTPTDVSTPDEQKITITFDVDGKKTSVAVKKGEIPSYSGELKKESTAEFDYEFDGWDKEVVAATEETTYTAKFKETKRQYTYKFVDVDGKELKSEKVNYGTQILAPDTNPEKTDTAEFDYTFDGWYLGNDKVTDFGTVTGDVTYVAKYSSVKNQYTYKFIVDGLVKATSKEDYGFVIQAPTDPIKESTAEFDFEFEGWYTEAEGGEKVTNFGTLSGDVTYYAHFKETKRQYTYIFVVEGTEISETAEYGSDIVVPENPTKASTVSTNYTFDGWYIGETKVETFGKLEANVTYTAKFNEVTRQYTYNFVVEGVDNKTTANYGEDIVVPEDPTKAPTVSTAYEFDGWYLGNDKVTEFGTVTGDVTYVAHFKEKVRKYTITFNNYNNELLATVEVEYNTLPEYTGIYPTKPETETEAYEFDGWDSQITEATETKTYTATYKTIVKSSTNKYTITFLDDDLTELYTTTVYEGQTPVYNGPEVTKEADARYSYVFTGWDNELVPATQSATYMATYDMIANKYTITFLDDDGSVIQSEELEYGYNVSKPDDPQKEDTDEFNYEFIGWYTKATEGELATNYTVLGNQTYYARYSAAKQMYSITFLNDNGSTITVLPLEYGASITAPQAPAKDSTQQYSYTFDGWYTEAEGGEKVTNFGTVKGNASYYARYTETVNKYTVAFYDETGTEITSTEIAYGETIQAPADPTKAATTEYFYDFDGWYTAPTGGAKVVSFGTVTGNVSYYARFTETLKLTVTFESDGATYKTEYVKEGAKVTKPADPIKDGYYLAYWTLNDLEFDFNTTIDSNITLVAHFEETVETEYVGYGTGLTAFTTLSENFTGKDSKNRPQLEADLTVGNFTFGKKSVLDGDSLNTQGAPVTIVLPSRGSILLQGSWGSGDKGKVCVYKVEGSNQTLIYSSPSSLSSKSSASFALDSMSLSAGTYIILGLKDTGKTDASIVITKIAYEKAVEYVNVSYELNNGETLSSTRIKKGTTLEELPAVTKSGYRFIGWYTTQTFDENSLFDLSNTIDSNITLYAKWEEIAVEDLVTISFNVNVEGKTIESIQIEKGTSLASLPTLDIEGYRFNKWFSDSNYQTEFTLDTIFNTDKTLYAEYIKTYSVEFLDKDGNTITKLTKDDDTLITEKITKPYVEGYKFDHWVDTATNQEFDIELEHVVSNLVLKAVYVLDATPVAKLALTKTEGMQEAAYVTFSKYALDSESADSYAVYVDNKKLDSKGVYLSTSGNTVRADIFGLTEGNHTVSVTPIFDEQEITAAKSEVSTFGVTAYDRSGYAHFNYTEGVGAYNDDGTLKENAIVLYVTDENKNTVELNFHDSVNNKDYSVKGIGNILNSAGKDNGSGKNSKGGLANSNDGCILALAQNNIPLVVRFIGCVSNTGLYKQGTFNANSEPLIEGLTKYSSSDWGGTKGDNGHMARMQSGTNITFEGVGDDAIIDGFGFHLICESAYKEYAKNFEVRNLTFINTPEDAIGMEGQDEESTQTITAPVEHCWVHHNTFLCPTISGAAASDKSEGDGSCDFKRGRYFTCSYNYFEECHKTNLVGAGKNSASYCLTYHHNLWYQCAARQPLARRANIHYYNNYVIGTSDTVSSLRANSYMYSEANYYLGCSRPVEYKAEGTTGVCKAFNNNVIGCFNNYDATEVKDREQTITANCVDNATGIDYSTFDIDPTKFYYDSVNKKSDCYLTDANQARIDCIEQSGSRYRTVLNNTVYKTNTAITDTASSATISGETSLTIAKGKGILKVFTVTTPVTVTMAATGTAGFDAGYLVKRDGTVMLELSSSNQTAVLMPGDYVVLSCIAFTSENGKNDKETTITTCTFKPFDSEELNQQLIAEYNQAHDAIPTAIEYTDSCYNTIKAAMMAYNNLGDLQSRITNYTDVTSAYETYKTLGINSVVAAINEIELPVTATNSSIVISARAAYSALINKVGSVTISNYDTLLEAETQMTSLGVDIFLNAASQIPATITYDSTCDSLIANAEAAYASLDSDQRNQSDVKTAYAKVTAARATYNDLEAAAEVTELISNANNLNTYEAAYNAYNELTATQKSYVEGYDSMVVTYVEALINSISSPVTVADATIVNKARAIYDSLSSDNKNAVSNYSVLVAAEQVLAEIGPETLDSYTTTDFSSWTITGTTSSTTNGLAGDLSTANTITAVSSFMLKNLTSITASVNVTDKGTTSFTFYTSADGENWTQCGEPLKSSTNGDATLSATVNVSGPVYVKIVMTCTKGEKNAKSTSLKSVSFNK